MTGASSALGPGVGHWDEARGKPLVMADSDQVKGKFKQAAGDITGDDELKNEGKVDETAGDIKSKIGGLVDKVKDRLNKD